MEFEGRERDRDGEEGRETGFEAGIERGRWRGRGKREGEGRRSRKGEMEGDIGEGEGWIGLLVGWFCCFTSQVNSYGHCGTVSSPNHTFSWAGLNKLLTSNPCTYFRL